MKHLVKLFTLVMILLLLAGCQSFESTATNVQERLSVLEEKGLPDSLISPIRMSLIAAQGDRRRNRNSDANKNIQKALDAVKNAEEHLERSLTDKKPQVIAKRNELARRAESDFTGLHKKDADSLIAKIDSLLGISFVFQAERVAQQFERDYARMRTAQATADSIRPRVPGTWVFTDTTKHAHDKNVNAIERKTFVFNRNGTATLTEEKSGQSAPNLREQWRFQTFGNWDLRGSTIHIFTNRWIGHEQRFWSLNDGKWGHVDQETNRFVERPNVVPADTLTIDHEEIVKQNRFVPFSDLEQEFRRQR